MCYCHGSISCRTGTDRLFLMQYRDPVIPLSILISNGTAPIGRCIINDKNFNISKSLTDNTVETLPKILPAVPYRDDNTDGRSFHITAPLPPW